MKHDLRIELMAEAWAELEGEKALNRFQLERSMREGATNNTGTYSGYCDEMKLFLRALETRGWTIRKIEK